MATPELDYITINGFKSIASVKKLPLGPINLIIGPNGSGKSNFIGVFAFLHAIREGRLNDYVRKAGGAEQLLHFGSKTTKRIQLQISFCDQVNQYYLSLAPSADDSLYPSAETVYYWDKTHQRPLDEGIKSLGDGHEAGISSAGLKGIADWVRHRLGRWRLYHVHDTSASSPMRKTAKL
ncbi:MAG: AAA family ATPase, partial [Desulfosarcina sp.]|nr:AAA family ATPase [Desulfosarcina sp.]